jgi:hypothetical protein
MAADARILDEDEETGAKKYRQVRTGPDHFSLAFTYAWIVADRIFPPGACTANRTARHEYVPFADDG